ncbi:MAG TPA: hypothetical protein VHT91_38810 [Kofleriaceae bacterium]|nr:hypothetical protein [Kofleriaceae bacterium]
MEGSNGPDWLREAAAAVRDEAVRFLVTVLQCTRHPRRFAAAWFAGETRAPNPIGYVSTALAVTAAVKSVTGALIGIDDNSGLWSSLAVATLPYAYYALLGVLCHIVLRLTGPTRPLSASLAIALYVGGGPGLLLALAIDIDVLLYFMVTDHPQLQHAFVDAPSWAVPILYGLVMVTSGVFVNALASALSGLHASRRRTLVAIVVALVVSGLLLSALHSTFQFSLGVPHFLFQLHGGSPISLQF